MNGMRAAASDQVVALPGSAGIEEAHQGTAIGAGPTEDLERIAGHPGELVRLALEVGELEAFDQEGVNAGAGLRFPLQRQVDLPVGLASREIVHIERPEGFELSVQMRGEVMGADRVDVVLRDLAEEVGIDVASTDGPPFGVVNVWRGLPYWFRNGWPCGRRRRPSREHWGSTTKGPRPTEAERSGWGFP